MDLVAFTCTAEWPSQFLMHVKLDLEIELGKKKGAQGAFFFMQEDSGAETEKARLSGGAHHMNRRVWG